MGALPPGSPHDSSVDDDRVPHPLSKAPTPEPVKPSAGTAAWSLPARAAAAASGTVGFAIKLFLLGLVNAIAVWGFVILVGDEKWLAVAILLAATAAIDAVYLVPRRAYPLKFIVPGTVFLLAFQVAPIVYNVDVAFSNWSTGHIATKDEAVLRIQQNSLSESAESATYVMRPARDGDGDLVLVLLDESSRKAFVGTREGLEPLPAGSVRVGPTGELAGTVPGYDFVPPAQLLSLDQELSSFVVPVGGNRGIRAEGFNAALELAPTLRYDKGADVFASIASGTVYRDRGDGAFVSANGDELEPGWRTAVGYENFSRVVRDPLVRDPFLRVFLWTVIFATLAVLLSFTLGLFLAIVLDKPKMRLQRTYRTLLVVPYAVPGFLSLLVWAGLLNDDFGVVNNIFHTSIPWLFDPTWAKVSVVVVSLWLTFPYFFLVSLGALQSIPGELVEAARVDGGSAWQIFRRVTLPLLLVAVAPLLIASFAFNFNNFNNIYLLTGGGPAANDQSVAGATDILISYTYKLAFESGKGQDYGLASAVSILIFFIVASISALSFWRSKSLENLA